ncbi:MAG TPA: 16S rRNA (guanine(527)-N(7))-methyltransferase RsmG [Pyrinomonadaceae bacterium]|nr:16S rRNA (guanine(527)-N(7))-methyltransferase RsmG [Pyrinomonadaceae bacterium]
MSSSRLTEFTDALQASAADYGVRLDQESLDGLCAYYEILNSWNARLHLVAPTSPAEFATRHVLESLTILQDLDDNALVADVGSGGGLPIVPVLIVRQDIRATLVESSRKKAVFLREALKETKIAGRGTVINDRFENVPAPAAGYVTCRAIERFEELIPKLVEWAPPATRLLLFGGEGLKKSLESAGLVTESRLLPNSERRLLIVARKQAT